MVMPRISIVWWLVDCPMQSAVRVVVCGMYVVVDQHEDCPNSLTRPTESGWGDRSLIFSGQVYREEWRGQREGAWTRYDKKLARRRSKGVPECFGVCV